MSVHLTSFSLRSIVPERLSGFFFFFFQAEDGIRDYKVTGVQTCALPISSFPRVDSGAGNHSARRGFCSQKTEAGEEDLLRAAVRRDGSRPRPGSGSSSV